MNPIINLMIKENNYSLERLKQIYHLLAKKIHPDVAKKKYDFVMLKEYYEEARGYISKFIENKKNDIDKNNIEENYIFAIGRVLRTNVWDNHDKIPDEIVISLNNYDSKIAQLLNNYKLYISSVNKFDSSVSIKRRNLHQFFSEYYSILFGDNVNIFLNHEKDINNRRVYDERYRDLFESIGPIIHWLKEDLIKRGMIKND